MLRSDTRRHPRPVAARQRWRLVIRRDASAPPQTPAEWQAAWEEALTTTGLPLVWTGARSPRPRFVPALPLPSGMAAEGELADVVMAERLPRWVVRGAIEHAAPAGHTLVGCHDVWVGEPSLPGQVVAAEYDLALAGNEADHRGLKAAVAQLVAADRLIRRRARGERLVEYDLRPLILLVTLADEAAGATEGYGPVLRTRLRHDPERGVGRPDEVLRALSERAGMDLRPTLVTRTRVIVAGDTAATSVPPAARRVARSHDE